MAATMTSKPDAAQADYMVDEAGNPIDVRHNSTVKIAAGDEPAVGITGPTSWWRIGLVALFIVAAILLGMQLLSGNKGTDVIPGTPVAAPQNNVPVPQS